MEEKTESKVETPKEEFPPSIWSFLFFAGFAVLALFMEGWVFWLGVPMFSILALLSFPHREGHAWIKRQINFLLKLSWSLLKFGFWIGVILGGFWLLSSIFDGIGKYEGMSAEEWYYEYADAEDRYDQLHSCVEDYVNTEEYSALDDIYLYCL